MPMRTVNVARPALAQLPNGPLNAVLDLGCIRGCMCRTQMQLQAQHMAPCRRRTHSAHGHSMLLLPCSFKPITTSCKLHLSAMVSCCRFPWLSLAWQTLLHVRTLCVPAGQVEVVIAVGTRQLTRYIQYRGLPCWQPCCLLRPATNVPTGTI
jgi:hypothetical protein